MSFVILFVVTAVIIPVASEIVTSLTTPILLAGYREIPWFFEIPAENKTDAAECKCTDPDIEKCKNYLIKGWLDCNCKCHALNPRISISPAGVPFIPLDTSTRERLTRIGRQSTKCPFCGLESADHLIISPSGDKNWDCQK